MTIVKKAAPATGRWSTARERRFLDHLAASSNVAASERVAMVPAGSAYRRRTQSAEFRVAWEVALREGYTRLELALLQRAIEGTPVIMIDRQGKTRKTREYSERLALNLLAQHREAVAATGAIDADESAKARLARKLEEMADRLDAEEAAAAAANAPAAAPESSDAA
ncbi:hypothetical protein [Sphingomonas sp.]|uniref:hypothetical protein n=1 Tax=Sphingomonas sp. TaxID=28214 RepID=UPI003B00F97D